MTADPIPLLTPPDTWLLLFLILWLNQRSNAWLTDLGCARHKEGVPSTHGQGSDVEGVEPVDVLLKADGLEDSALRDVLGEG